MSALSIDQQIALTELLATLIGIAITWAVYFGSEKAELPGESTIPDPAMADDVVVDTKGRTLT